MTQEELAFTIRELKTDMHALKTNTQTLTSEWGEFLELEAARREDGVVEKRARAESESKRAADEAANWERGQTFFAKHGLKVASFIFSIITAGLAWYGSQIRGEIRAEQRAAAVDTGIQENTDNFTKFKDQTDDNITVLQRESVNQTLMIDEGFKRVDKIMVKATKLTEEDLPERPPEFKKAVDDAKALQVHTDKFEKKEQKP